MDLAASAQRLRSGEGLEFPEGSSTLGFARSLDSKDQLRHLRDEFVLPTKASLKKKGLDGSFPGTFFSFTGGIERRGHPVPSR